jgi:hypothetical protein
MLRLIGAKPSQRFVGDDGNRALRAARQTTTRSQALTDRSRFTIDFEIQPGGHLSRLSPASSPDDLPF